MAKINFEVPLKVAVFNSLDGLSEANPGIINKILNQNDDKVFVNTENFKEHLDVDLFIHTNPCGYAFQISKVLAEKKIPTIAISPYLMFHPYHAALYRELKEENGIALPALNKEEIIASINALRAAKALKSMKLIAAYPKKTSRHYPRFSLEAELFFPNCLNRLGITIIEKNCEEIKELAKKIPQTEAEEELRRWEKSVFDGKSEMDQAHCLQVVKLYLAQRSMLEENNAVGITTCDIAGFLQAETQEIMPNAAYTALVNDGYLACEEGDIQVLTSELLLSASQGVQPTMSNFYYAYRDEFDKLNGKGEYTKELEAKDAQQCFDDNIITMSHFGAMGVLPPNMIKEKQPKFRACPPEGWQNQSIGFATPKNGKIILARLSANASAIHFEAGELISHTVGDQFGWYRGRMFIKLQNAYLFAQKSLHHHYALAYTNTRDKELKILTDDILKLNIV